MKEATQKLIGTESGVRLSLVLGLLSICASGFAVWIWWAATISAKLDNIILQQSAQAAAQTKLTADVDELKAWRKVVDTVGSGPVQSMGDRIRAVEKELELHKMTTRP